MWISWKSWKDDFITGGLREWNQWMKVWSENKKCRIKEVPGETQRELPGKFQESQCNWRKSRQGGEMVKKDKVMRCPSIIWESCRPYNALSFPLLLRWDINEEFWLNTWQTMIIRRQREQREEVMKIIQRRGGGSFLRKDQRGVGRPDSEDIWTVQRTFWGGLHVGCEES